jgi:hypothetical protein
MLKKTSFYIATLAVGIVLAAAGLLFNGETSKAAAGVLLGLGAGLTGMSAANLLMKRYERNHPEVARQTEIEQSDERSVMIRNRARAVAGTVTQWLMIAFAFVLILADAPLWQTLTVVGVYTAYHVLYLALAARYQKQM